MNRKLLFAVVVGLAISAGTLTACQSSTKASKAALPASTPTLATPSKISSTGITLPVASNPIANNSTKPALRITYSAVENNVDPLTKKAIGDQLELTLQNSGTTTLTGLEIYYEMTDIVTKAKESYYQKLAGLTIPADQSSTIYFDNGNQLGHYPENQFSLYRSSPNEVDFKVWVSATGSKIAQSTAIKSTGTGEKPGA
jgi:hypothetical protein